MPGNPVKAKLFGKLPTHGDFVSRGLTLAEKTRLDDWLSREMDLARSQCGDGFEARYDQAGPWCFAGPCADGQWQGGALCPSMDSAGRRFPLFVACCGVAAAEAASAAEFCVDAIFQAFGDRLFADDLSLAVSGAQLAAGEAATAQEWWADGDDRSASMTLRGEYPDGLITTMLESLDL